MRKPEALGTGPEASGFVLMMVEFSFFDNTGIIDVSQNGLWVKQMKRRKWKKKVPFFDRHVKEDFYSRVTGISTVSSLVFIFYSFPDDTKIKLIAAAVFSLVMLLIYVQTWHKANTANSAEIKVNGTEFVVRVGDIFEQTNAWKVIPCNEYYDIIVDGRLVSPKSIHGQYLNMLSDNDRKKLIESIQTDPRMKHSIRWVNSDRIHGNKIAYQLGTVYPKANFFLLAFTRFDKDDRAYLTNELLWNCLLNMWNEIDILHSGKSISFPLMGTGLTRLKNFKLSEQQLLEMLIMSYRLSGFTFGSDVSISIIIHPSHEKHIDFNKIKDLSD